MGDQRQATCCYCGRKTVDWGWTEDARAVCVDCVRAGRDVRVLPPSMILAAR